MKKWLALSVCVLAMACTKDDSPKGAPAGGGGGGGGGGGMITAFAGPAPFDFEKAYCKNPIDLESNDLKPIKSVAELPKGKFKIALIQLFQIEEGSYNSFVVSTSTNDNFHLPEVECNGVIQRNTDDYFKGQIQMSETIDLAFKTPSLFSRSLEVKFKNGQSVFGQSVLVPDVQQKAAFDDITLDRVQAGDGAFATMRIYKLSEGQLEIRFKLELQSDSPGRRVIQFARGIYTLSY